ncbi:MAG TPA: hypothetical protein V6C85_30170 [Allocoleopsis sp.]
MITEQADILEAVIPTKTDKEVIHPSQFMNCPLLLLEARFLLLSPKNRSSLYTLTSWQQPTLQSPKQAD